MALSEEQESQLILLLQSYSQQVRRRAAALPPASLPRTAAPCSFSHCLAVSLGLWCCLLCSDK
jgi:hypothetical protein